MKKYKINEHLIELKSRILKILIFFLIAFGFSYYFKDEIYLYLTNYLQRKVIYTGLAEAFFTHIKLSSFIAFCLSIPIIAFQTYKFIIPGLYQNEKRIAAIILSLSPILFYIGGGFVFYFVIPKALGFFLSFEIYDDNSPLILEPRISEYLDLITHLIIAFGLAFQLPIIFMILSLMNIIKTEFLIQKRRLSVVIIFIIAGIITPPDVVSQIALAIPMILLYEISIALCKTLENRNKNA